MENLNNFKLSFLVGFDRSGSSFIGRLLANHPQIELFMQPFNSTEVHETQWEIWDEGFKGGRKTKSFINKLRFGKIDGNYLKAHWFKRNSTTQKMEKNKLYVIKSTKLHLKIKWLQKNFPSINAWGIWRDPRGILNSLIRNNFQESWYGKFKQNVLKEAVLERGSLSYYSKYINMKLSDVEKMALFIAVRTHTLIEDVAVGNWLIYEKLAEDPNKNTRKLLKNNCLNNFDFKPYVKRDYNITGRTFEKVDSWKDSKEVNSKKIINIFKHLYEHPKNPSKSKV